MYATLLALALAATPTDAFISGPQTAMFRRSVLSAPKRRSLTHQLFAENPRTGFGQWLLDAALDSPLWKQVLVPQARQKIVSTAVENGIEWEECKSWIESQPGPWQNTRTSRTTFEISSENIPDYYKQPFHAYEDGNLCWDAALEAEVASAAVGARNFPEFGAKGEAAFRDSFGVALDEVGASMPQQNAMIVDLGCGTGLSTRWIGARYPEPSHKILGLDMSEYFVTVGRRLLELAPNSRDHSNGTWVSSIQFDPRIEYRQGDAAATNLPDNFADVVNLQFVAHELPINVTFNILREVHRILKPRGQLWFCEMDFETPAYAAQRANPLLFSLIRATEPYLDEYADHSVELRDLLRNTYAFSNITAATGRHFAVVATKGTIEGERKGVLVDGRFDEEGNYRVEDTHLKLWDNKE